MGFHSAGNVLLTGGGDKHLRFFKIDGEKNEKMLSTYAPSPLLELLAMCNLMYVSILSSVFSMQTSCQARSGCAGCLLCGSHFGSLRVWAPAVLLFI